jgi:hypothetical protein
LSPPEWEDIEIEPTHRARALPDGRLMRESRLTIPKEWMEQLWQGYRCAACLQEFKDVGLGAWPGECPVCHFPVKAEQRHRLEQDFVGEVEEMQRQNWVEREEAFLEKKFFVPKPQISVRRAV